MRVVLSKTNYILYRECPKNAWFKIHKPEIYFESKLSEFEQAIIGNGNEVDVLARQLFPDGELIKGRDEEAQKNTFDLLKKKRQVLFQPIFEKDNFFVALDILELNNDSGGYIIYEVKGSNSIDEKVHFHDLAFQVNVLRSLGLKIEKINLIHLNSEYVRSGQLDIQQLFKVDDVTKEVESVCEGVSSEMKEALKYLSQEVEPMGSCCCIYKGRSRHCSTFAFANPQVPEYGVHDIARIGSSKAKLVELVDGNIFELGEIPEHIKLSDIQKNQVEAHTLNKKIINKAAIAAELASLTFPLYFLDYETFPCAIPRFEGFSPYQQIPFQFSLHTVEAPGKEPLHEEFLHIDPTDPSTSLVESLREHIGSRGSILAWNKRFEGKINEELAIREPQYKVFLDDVNTRLYDLMEIFSKQNYVHKDFRGSTSIKYILPVLVPALSYADFEIKEGGEAAQSWNKIVTNLVTEDEKRVISANLKKYCGQDTYAMYAIWLYLQTVI